ncbi:rRNA maturation RNase YbeY [Paenibacillus popilliae]|uniref:Endoribonuclease YbeY n=1 Tax=Paenibacillus popilliae ATCC 14706 TaxID=1212764 RepID=M9M1X9_PAEPP|nr:rRNA maturation RNase YbeY [Paenibacillus popilliae]GAC42959.1 predicted hydrolase [Paenibacillus popilliae ATCC 14706]
MHTVKLEWNNEQVKLSIEPPLIELLERILQEAARTEGVDGGEVALTFVDDAAIHALNREYRGIDRPTDVLSFAMRESTDEEMDILYEVEEDAELEGLDDDLLGDIIISTERAQAQAEEYGHSLEREIGFLFVHGFLHLLGYEHQDEKSEREMMDKQAAVLGRVGLIR